jgi:hypothetical protein
MCPTQEDTYVLVEPMGGIILRNPEFHASSSQYPLLAHVDKIVTILMHRTKFLGF